MRRPKWNPLSLPSPPWGEEKVRDENSSSSHLQRHLLARRRERLVKFREILVRERQL